MFYHAFVLLYQQNFSKQLIENSLPGRTLSISPAHSVPDLNLSELLLHIYIFMNLMKAKRMFGLFTNLVFQPAKMKVINEISSLAFIDKSVIISRTLSLKLKANA